MSWNPFLDPDRADVKLLSVESIVHAGGVLRDASIPKQNMSGAREVLTPKANAMLRLSTYTHALRLHDTTAFSSTASLLGPPGQANYAAANAAVDACCFAYQNQGESRCLLSALCLLYLSAKLQVLAQSLFEREMIYSDLAEGCLPPAVACQWEHHITVNSFRPRAYKHAGKDMSLAVFCQHDLVFNLYLSIRLEEVLIQGNLQEALCGELGLLAWQPL